MNSENRGGECQLDRIRRTRGAKVCRCCFHTMAKNNRKQACEWINDDNLTFGSLFLLAPFVREAKLEPELNERNRAALQLCEIILDRKKTLRENAKKACNCAENHDVLLWMFQTGARDDGLSEDFDEILDIAVSVLIKNYNETSILPAAAELVFGRNRKGTYCHDLIWALFQTHDPDILRLFAKYLRSPRAKDASFARTILNLPACGNSEQPKQFQSYEAWLEENKPYLFFTGENFHCSSRPCLCGVDQGAKYLCKNISPCSRTPISPLTDNEKACLESFRCAGDTQQAALCRCSQRIHRQDPSQWGLWMRLPVEEQIRLAAQLQEGNV
jgi:hypothetical protein